MRAIAKRLGILMALALLVTTVMAACSANQTPSGAGPGSSQTTSPAGTTAPAAVATLTPTASAIPSGAGGVQNLVISSALRSELTSIFVADIGIQVSDLPGGGPIQGDTYYAYDPATDTYWAYATFPVNGAAPANVIAAFRAHGQSGLFRKSGAGSWQLDTSSAEGDYCAVLHFFPSAVLVAWALPTTLPPYQTC